MQQEERGRGLSAAAAILIVLGLIIAAALSFNVGQNAVRLITVTQTNVDSVTITTTQISTSTVTVTTTPPDYFQVSSVVLYSGTASSRTAQGTANLEFSVTGPLATTSTAIGEILKIDISNTTSSTYPAIFQCSSSTSCTVMSEAVVKDYGITNFNTPATAFYIGARIVSGQTYGYDIIFSNGNSVAGSVTAQ
jgi:hypothetical protein